MQEQADQAPKKEQEEVERIIKEYALMVSGSEYEANMLMSKLAVMLEKGVKLVHINDVVFAIFIKGKGFVEFQPMYAKKAVGHLAVAIKKLVAYLKAIGTKVMYTTDGDELIPSAIKKTNMGWKKQSVTLPDGEKHEGYYLKVA